MKNTKLQDNWKVNNLQYKSMNLNKLLTTLHIFKKKKKVTITIKQQLISEIITKICFGCVTLKNVTSTYT